MDEIHLKNYGTSNEPYYLASDIGIILGIKRIRSTLHLVHDKNKFKMYHNTSGGKQLCYFINTNGLKTIVISSRKPMSIDLCKKLNIKYDMKILPKETEFVYSLKKAFKTLYIEEQYRCLNYRIDLFIPSLNLAIEFDENNHKSNQLKDLKRQIKIENVLKCSFMRINEKDDIFEVINLIVEKIMNVKNNLTPSLHE